MGRKDKQDPEDDLVPLPFPADMEETKRLAISNLMRGLPMRTAAGVSTVMYVGMQSGVSDATLWMGIGAVVLAALIEGWRGAKTNDD